MKAALGHGVVAVILAGAMSATAAQTIFRCGDSYSQAPCVGAKAIEVAAPATDAQRAEARAVAAREKQLAFEMVRDRRERESLLRPATASSLGPAPAAAAASAPAKKHGRGKKHAASLQDDRDFLAAVPRAKK
jgi:hypothetical protein